MRAGATTGLVEQARAFGWELAELMLEVLAHPTSSSEAEAAGRHAAQAIEARARHVSVTGDSEDGTRAWVDAASWGFRDRMAIAREVVAGAPVAVPSASPKPPASPTPISSPSPDPGASAPAVIRVDSRKQALDAALRLIGTRDASQERAASTSPDPARKPRPKADAAGIAEPPVKPEASKRKPRPKAAAKPAARRRAKPVPVA